MIQQIAGLKKVWYNKQQSLSGGLDLCLQLFLK